MATRPVALRSPLRRSVSAALLAVVASCGTGDRVGAPADTRATDVQSDPSARARAWMVQQLRESYAIRDERVLAAMARVPRHRFVPMNQRERAYFDRPLPIGFDQTISQPFIVAAMTEAARVTPASRVLEIGTGSGYQAAVLAEIAREVFSIEIVRPLGDQARAVLLELGYRNVEVRIGDGYRGWPEAAPFDAIVVTAAPDHVPEPLREQLKVGGRLVMPVGDLFQELVVITRTADGFAQERLMGVRFVPMTGEAQKRNQ